MLTLILLWAAVGIGLILITGRFSAGLSLAYFLALSIIHVPGAMLYVGSEESIGMAGWTQVGFEQTITGMIVFLVGVTIAKYATFLRRQGRLPNIRPPRDLIRQQAAALDRLGLLYLCIGGISSFIIMPLLAGVATITAAVSSLGSLIVVGLCLRLSVARESRNWPKFWLTMVLLPVLPIFTLINGGFLGGGTSLALAVVCFLIAQSKRQFAYLLIAPAVLFIGLSVFVTYMASRNDMRRLVWVEQASLGDRIQRVEDALENFEWFDISNFKHRRTIDSRLNQNWIVGAAVARLESGQVEFASGATLGNVALNLIPRALWPDKPDVGGGGTLVHDFTGIKFAEGTSVGAGQVFEFYVNFGALGIIGGFLLFGYLIGWMDFRVSECFHQGDQKGFLFWFMICLALLQPGGNLLEMTVSAASSVIVAYGFSRLLNGRTLQRVPVIMVHSPRA